MCVCVCEREREREREGGREGGRGGWHGWLAPQALSPMLTLRLGCAMVLDLVMGWVFY